MPIVTSQSDCLRWPKDESVSNHATNSEGSRLMWYVVDATERWINEQPCIKFWGFQTYALCCWCHWKTNQQTTMHQILRDPDLCPTLLMPEKDESASDHALNSKMSRLTIDQVSIPYVSHQSVAYMWLWCQAYLIPASTAQVSWRKQVRGFKDSKQRWAEQCWWDNPVQCINLS